MLAVAVAALTVIGLTGLGMKPEGTVMLATAICLCALWGILRKNGCQGWFYVAVLAAILAATLLFRRQVMEGFRLFWNQAGDAMLRGTGWVLPQWALQLAEGRHGFCRSLFAGFLGCSLAVVCCGMVAWAPGLLAATLPCAVMGGMAIFGADGAFPWLLPALGVAGLLLLCGGWKHKDSGAPVALGWLLCGIAAGALLLCATLPDIRSWAGALSEDLHRAAHAKQYETVYTTLPEGDFTRYQAVETQAQPALAVTMEKPQQLWLRGFTGAEFRENQWQGLDGDALVKNRQLLYWLNRNAFDLNAQFAAAGVLPNQSTVTVQNMGACSYYRYVPFSICEGGWTQPENLNTDGVYADGARSYVYAVLSADGEDILQTLRQLQSAEDPQTMEYRKAESGYRKFVREHYLQIPQEVRALLQEQWDAVAANYGGIGNLTPAQGQTCALVFLSRCFPETGTPEDIRLPLEMAAGTSYQYATVAALTLRYFGIPARYAEGYVIPEKMAADAESGQTLTVDSSCAKAWVEVYQEGIGWIPMELTPGMGEMLEEIQGDGLGTGEGESPENDKKPEEEPQEESVEDPQPTGGAMILLMLKTVLWGLLAAAAVLLLVLLALAIRRKVLLERKEQLFRSENCAQSIAWIYADTACILEKLGFSRGNGSMRALRGALEESFGPEFAAQFDLASDLNDRALFSGLAMSEKDRQAAEAFRILAVENLKKEVTWYRRLWLKWIGCLY